MLQTLVIIALTLVAPALLGFFKPEWFLGLWNKFGNRVLQKPELQNKLDNPVGLKFIEVGFAVISNLPDTDEEKAETVKKINEWLEAYKRQPPISKSFRKS